MQLILNARIREACSKEEERGCLRLHSGCHGPKGTQATQEQVHLKVKQLRQAYARATRGGAAAGAATCPYFPALDRLLGGGAVRASLGDSEPGPEGPDPGTPEGPPQGVPALESAGSSRETVPAAPAARAGRTTPAGTCSRTHGLLRTTTTEQEYWDEHLRSLRALHRTVKAWMRADLQLCQEQLAEVRGLNSNLQALCWSCTCCPPNFCPSSYSCPPSHLFLLNPHTLFLNVHTPHLNLRTLHPIPPGTPRPPPSPCWEAVGPARSPPQSLSFLPLLSLASPFQLPPPSFPPPLSHTLSCPFPPPLPRLPTVLFPPPPSFVK
ncbi:uncharacterized protein LOC142827533 [Pelodiscus sinensis]|uniref:uncharacterized protein LOC142827533 n=1 Tax=Pelodiscus sinensis TaxID=13735 RepID=UPI003F6AA2DA